MDAVPALQKGIQEGQLVNFSTRVIPERRTRIFYNLGGGGTRKATGKHSWTAEGGSVLSASIRPGIKLPLRVATLLVGSGGILWRGAKGMHTEYQPGGADE